MVYQVERGFGSIGRVLVIGLVILAVGVILYQSFHTKLQDAWNHIPGRFSQIPNCPDKPPPHAPYQCVPGH